MNGSLGLMPSRPKRLMPTGQKPPSTMPSGSGLWRGRARMSSAGSSGLMYAPLKPMSASTPSAAALATLQKGPASRSRASLCLGSSGSSFMRASSSAGNRSRCQGALQTKWRAPSRVRWARRRRMASSSSGQMTGGSHQQMRGAMVREISAVRGESHRPVFWLRQPRVSRPCGMLARTTISGRGAGLTGRGRRGSLSTALLGRVGMRSSRACHSLRICISSGSRRSMRKTGVPALGVLCLGRRSIRVPALGVRRVTGRVACQRSSSTPTRR